MCGGCWSGERKSGSGLKYRRNYYGGIGREPEDGEPGTAQGLGDNRFSYVLSIWEYYLVSSGLHGMDPVSPRGVSHRPLTPGALLVSHVAALHSISPH